MDFYLLILSSLLLILCTQCLSLFIKKRSQLPPGPTGLPIIGSLLTIGNRPYMSLSKLSKTYGPIMTVKFGSVNVVIASSSEMAKEILQKNDLAFIGRPTPTSVSVGLHHDMSLIWSSGLSPHWKTLRRICNTHLFTPLKLDGLSGLRHRMMGEMIGKVEEARRAHLPVDIGKLVFGTSLNVITNTLFSGESGTRSDEMKEILTRLLELVLKPNIGDYVPLLSWFDPQGIVREVSVVYGKVQGLLGDIIAQRVDQRKSGSDGCGDFLDVLLDQGELTHLNIMILFLDLVVGATHTTTMTMEWAMAELLRNPPILARLKQEISDKIPPRKLVEECDTHGLVYLDAIIKEVMRLHPITPLLFPRLTEQQVQIDGYTIPKHTQVLVNIWAIQMDPANWADPTSFKPDRFLGNVDVDARGSKDCKFIPFGAGRRICPGLNLATRSVSLMIANLVHNVDAWELLDGLRLEEIDMTPGFGIALSKLDPLVAIPTYAKPL